MRALTFMTAFVLLWAWVAWNVHRLDSEFGWTLPDWLPALSIPVMLAGAALLLACVGTFIVRGRGTPAPFDAPREFVAVGPYRYVRNPMYIGGFTVLLGFGLYQDSPAILLFACAWLVGAHLFVVCVEEPGLQTKFARPYKDYCAAVPRWLPKRTPRRMPDPR